MTVFVSDWMPSPRMHWSLSAPSHGKPLNCLSTNISRAATEFQGTRFLAYDQHFARQAANDLHISWDQVDIELCRVTFSGLAKPHCLVCSSPHHSQSSCPSASPFCQSSKNSPVCFCFNRSSGCNSRSCPFQFDKRSKHFSQVIILFILMTLSLSRQWTLLREN